MAEPVPLEKNKIENIKNGMTVSYTKTITDSDIKDFSDLSSDRNSVRKDESYVRESDFENKIAHGMLTASFFSGVFGSELPDEGCVYTYQSWSFKKPVYVGDTVVSVVTVKNVNIRKRQVRFDAICKVKDKTVIEGEAEIYMPFICAKKIINDKRELKVFKNEILNLFFKCFGKKLDEEMWDWAYQENPNGDPIVSLCFDGNKLIGHYAVIPMAYAYNKNKIKGLLSITTMVDPYYRKYGVFIEQAADVYEISKKLGYKFVCGFPNKNAAPGRKKRLGWTLDDTLRVKSLTYKKLLQLQNEKVDNAIKFDVDDHENMSWRMKKPGAHYMIIGDNIVKNHDNAYDLVYVGTDLSILDSSFSYNVIVNKNFYSDSSNLGNEYIFGYKLLDASLDCLDFKIDLIMSDVF